MRFWGIVESSVDSAELWNRWLIKVGKGKRILLLAKAKSSKNFYALRADLFLTGFCECRIYNRSNGGVALHGVLPLARK